MSKVIIAPSEVKIDLNPLIFLAGPIQGAGDWHSEAIKIIHSLRPDIYIASPKRVKRTSGDFSKDMFNEQVDWETRYLKKAAMRGAILFWLANEELHDCSRAYAQTTRFELAEWKARYEIYGIHITIGIEEGFPGARYIRRRFEQDCRKITIHSNLIDTCKDAISQARG